MDTKGILRIEKRPLAFWLIVWIIALPLCWGTVFNLLSLPTIIKYTADVSWIGLLCFMVYRKAIMVDKKVFPLVLLVVSFLLYCSLMYIFNFQSVIYFLWGLRNNFRFYVLFFAVVSYFREDDGENFFRILDILFWINALVILIQYFVLNYAQDLLGGIFGVDSGVNASTIIFFAIVVGRSVLKYMDKKENFFLCAFKCTVSLFIAALAEIKFYFLFFIIILIMAAFLTSFSWRKLLIFIVCAVVVAVASTLLVTLFGFDDFLSFKNIWESATQKHYSSSQTVNRLSAIPTLAEMVVPKFKDRLLGFGLGNCDTSSFEICNTPFYQTYGHLRYNFFSAAFLFLEVGYLGIVIYVAFFVLCFCLIRKRTKEGLCNNLHGQIGLIVSVLAIILVVYNSSLRAEIGYMVYFVLALPFLTKQSLNKNSYMVI